MSDTPNPSNSVLWFFILTVIYAFVEYSSSKNMSSQSNTRLNFGIYILLVFIGEFFINLGLTTSMCGTTQWTTAMLVTVFPWGFIFGILILLLNLFPEWLSPFSNTFGYGIAIMAGLNTTLADILEPNPKQLKTENYDESMHQALAHIYSDKSLLVNEITLTNFEYFWDNMKGVFQKGVHENNDLKNELYSYIVLKNTVASSIWYILTGILITSISYNYIINTSCSVSASDMQKRHAEYEEELAQAQEVANTSDQRVYTTTE